MLHTHTHKNMKYARLTVIYRYAWEGIRTDAGTGTVTSPSIMPLPLPPSPSHAATHRCGYGYRGSAFYEVLPNFAAMGGDITKGDGTGGVAALGPSFTKEKSNIKHVRGTVSMVVDAEGAVRSQ